MPRIFIKETITKEIEIPMDKLFDLVDHLTEEERLKLLERIQDGPGKFAAFKRDKIESIIADFEATNLYEEQFLKDLEEGLRKSSVYSR
jgi:hypothetical protein